MPLKVWLPDSINLYAFVFNLILFTDLLLKMGETSNKSEGAKDGKEDQINKLDKLPSNEITGS